MAGRQLDDIARMLSIGANRRTMLKGFGGLALGSLGLLAAHDAGSAEEATVVIAGRRCRRACLRRCRRRNGDDCRERCCGDDDD